MSDDAIAAARAAIAKARQAISEVAPTLHPLGKITVSFQAMENAMLEMNAAMIATLAALEARNNDH